MSFLDSLEKYLVSASNFVWGYPLLILLFGTHVYLTIRLRFIQRFLPTAIRLSLGRTPEGNGDISQFGALMTALAATIGTGNIIGVASAITMGGPGAVFWMWMTGVFGISTKYAEAVLAVKYRVLTPQGQMAGGPMYVLDRGLKCRWLGIAFALLTAIAAFGIGCMVQVNSIATLAQETFHINPWISGIVMTLLTALVILGGIKSISRVCEKLVPFMAIFYILGCLVLLFWNWKSIPDTVLLIINSAFSGQAVVGGFAGAGMKEAMRYGISRGLFSNESGMGSAPIVAAAAQTKNSVRQALVSCTGTFWDTVIICALTGLVIVNSGLWKEGLQPASLTHAAFENLPVVGSIILTVGLLTFVFSTVLGWSYYGEKAVEYLWGIKAVNLYRKMWIAAVMVGSVISLKSVWAFADIANGLMAVPNLISLIALSGVIVNETKEYLWNNQLDRQGPPPPQV